MAIIGSQISGVKSVTAALKSASLKGKKSAKVHVGYSGTQAPYGLYVHEDLTKFHPVGQAKFLEEPTRRYKIDMTAIIARSLKNKDSLETALFRAGNFLKQRSQELVPVETGNLKDAAFVRIVR